MSDAVPRAIVLDVDGVLTDTAALHEIAWKRLFDPLLEGDAPFTRADYLLHVDGKPRRDGLRDFLASRGRPTGDLEALAARKNALFHAVLAERGVEPFPEVPDQLRRWRDQGLRLAAASSSRNMAQVLRAAGLADLVDAQVGGRDLEALGLPGKPAPDLFLEAARRLGVPPAQAWLVEDARSGVEAGRRGGFAQVIGLARRPEDRGALRDAGADRVVAALDGV